MIMSGVQGQGRFQKGKLSRVRAKFHDYNSQRRSRNKSTVSWQEYRKNTRDGVKQYTRKKP